MDKNEIQKVIRDEIDSYMNQKQFNLSKIQAHKHNGLDVQKIEENDLLASNQYPISWLSQASEVFTVSGIPNFSHLTFYGVASKGAWGGGPYNEKATITGEARVGKIFPINTVTGTDYYSNGTPDSTGFYQACTSAYTDVTSVSKQFVSASGTDFALVTDDGVSNVVVRGTITAITNSSIEITITLAANWYLRGFFFLS